MKKLQILVPQYNETEEVIRGLLDSISVQQGVDFNNIEILVGNDGSDVKLSDAFIASYPYSIQYFQFQHTGPAGTRQQLFDKATAEYVMFCDADDMVSSVLALYTIFAFTRKGFDVLISDFLEEIYDRKGAEYQYMTHRKDIKFVHGKVYRRRHLVDNNIVWQKDFTCHEDGAYNILAIETAKSKEYCKLPIYLWRWRDNSICRSDPLYTLKTYPQAIASNEYIVQELLKRKMYDRAKYHVGTLIYSTYFMLNRAVWIDPMNAKYRYETEVAFKSYYAKYKELFIRITPEMRGQIISATRQPILNEGVLLERFTFDQWIEHILEV